MAQRNDRSRSLLWEGVSRQSQQRDTARLVFEVRGSELGIASKHAEMASFQQVATL